MKYFKGHPNEWGHPCLICRIFFSRGEQKTYDAEEWLFHESTPRQWAGLVVEGEVEIVRGLHGATKHLVVLAPGAMISEGAFLDDQAHANGAFTRQGTTVWQMSRDRDRGLSGGEAGHFL